jgi:tetratricopeptide (TPR) repeat protein
MSLCQGRVGDQVAGTKAAEEALTLVQTMGDDETIARAINNVAAFYSNAGDVSRAAQLLNQQIAITHRLGHHYGESVVLVNLGYEYIQLGLFGMACSALEQSLRLSESIGARRVSTYCQLNLALAYTRIGDFINAQQTLEDSISVLLDLDDSFGQAAGYCYLALTLENSGDLDGAMRYFFQATQLYSEIGAVDYEIDALSGLSRCHLAQNNLDEAKIKVAKVWKYLSEHGSHGLEFPIMAYLSCVNVFDAIGGSSKALSAIKAGYDDLIERAEKISDLDWRESFLTNVPEHCEIIRLWETRVANSNKQTKS